VSIGESLVERLMLDHDIDDIIATDLFYNSVTFAQLSNASTGLYLKSWQEIYEMLKKELAFANWKIS
jgi:AraC-like DNA-binding protein